MERQASNWPLQGTLTAFAPLTAGALILRALSSGGSTMEPWASLCVSQSLSRAGARNDDG